MSESQEVFDILDGLTSPTADEVYTDVREYDTRDVLAAVGATAKAGGGGGGSQSVKLVKFEFAYNDANLEDGIAAYTPAVGELLLDAAISVTEAWDQPIVPFTFIKADIGLFTAGKQPIGYWITSGNIRDMTIADSLVTLSDSANLGVLTTQGIDGGTTLLAAVSHADGSGFPLTFVSTDPLCVAVCGVNTDFPTDLGVSPGSTQGAATLYMLIGMPA